MPDKTTSIPDAAGSLNLNVVTIRRYIYVYKIRTVRDENDKLVLPESSLDELIKTRRLLEAGKSQEEVLIDLQTQRTESS